MDAKEQRLIGQMLDRGDRIPCPWCGAHMGTRTKDFMGDQLWHWRCGSWAAHAPKEAHFFRRTCECQLVEKENLHGND